MRLIAILATFLLAGCTTTSDLGAPVDSVAAAGVSTVRSEPVFVPEGQKLGGKSIEVKLGKEYASFTADVDLLCTGNEDLPAVVKAVHISASGVSAFQGQAIAAGAVVEIRRSLTEQSIQISTGAMDAISTALEAYMTTIAPLP